jgi:lysyl-tRNA synthetase class II
MTEVNVKPKQTIRSFLQKWISSDIVDEKKRQLIVKQESADNQLQTLWRVLQQLYEESHWFSEEHYALVPRIKDLIQENKRLKKLFKLKNGQYRAVRDSIAERNFFENEALILVWKRACYQKFLYRKYKRELSRLNHLS